MFRSKFFRFLFILIILAALAAGIYYLGLWLRWPLWFAASVYGAIVGLGVIIILLQRWFFRRRERRFVERVVKQDISRLPVEEEEQQGYRDMEKRFLAAVDVLKTSEMSKKGNPVYALPWCMVLGESNSGKTMALRRAHLSAIQTQFNTVSNPTSSCDWWFSESAVILDMAGRFSEFGEDAAVRREWESFLTLLAKHRQREPLNSLVVTVSAERLMGDAEALDDYARTLRRRINELMRVVGARFPIYVLVAKMDMVPGFNAFAGQMELSARRQALGALNAEDAASDAFTRDCLDHLIDVMSDFRIMAANSKPGFDLSLLYLPGKLALLHEPLQRFTRILFSANPYLETPFFRGLFFASAKANDEKFANNPMATDRGAFLHDLFARLIPRDRYLFTPVREMLRWRTATGLLGWGSWLLICLCLACLLTLSFVENKRALHALAEQFAPDSFFAAQSGFSQSAGERLISLERLSSAILDMEMVNRNWSIPRMGLDQSIEGERRIKAFYGRMFAEGVQRASDMTLLRNINAVNASTPESVIPLYIEHLLWRMAVLQKGLDGASLDALEQVPAPAHPALVRQGLGFPDGNGPLYTSLYLRNLAWNAHAQNFEEQLKVWQAALANLVSFRGGRLDWLIGWANANPLLRPVTMEEFWGGSQFILRREARVPAAFTVRGREAIREFIEEVRDASRDKEQFRIAEAAFWDNYTHRYFAAWYNFAFAAPIGAEMTAPTDEMRLVAGQMSGFSNPYFLLLERMCEELEPLAAENSAPPWYASVRTFRLVMTEIRLKKAPATLGTMFSGTTHTVDKLSATMNPEQQNLAMRLAEVMEQLDAYQKSVNDMLPAIASPAAAFQFVSKVLQGPDVTSGSSFQIHNAKKSLEAFIFAARGAKGTPEVLERLVGGPYHFFHALLMRQALEELQRFWIADVYTPAEEAGAEAQHQMLCGSQDGAIPAFLEGPAKPFVIKRGGTYAPASFMGVELPLASDFLAMLRCPVAAPPSANREYRVKLAAEPTTVNRGSLDAPYLTTVTLLCEDKPEQRLENYNNRASQTFSWKYDSCDNARLDMFFSSMTLTREFHGPKGFPELLRLFRSGRASFQPSDFPEQERDLLDLGIREISTGLRLFNARPVIRFTELERVRIPYAVSRRGE